MKNLRRLLQLVSFLSVLTVSASAQSDSIIRFSDLAYHSDFERKALHNFILNQRDTFNLFLAIDENMTEGMAAMKKDVYSTVIRNLDDKNLSKKNLSRRVKTTYSTVHEKLLIKYNDNEYFPEIFQSGTYNCVSASILYALVFDDLAIPYKAKASPDHVYLVANPSSNSIVIETTNPGFEKKIFNGEFKEQYVNYLKSSKLISESEYKNKSVEEIFEEKFTAVKDVEFINLFGFQYYNKAISKLQNNDVETALPLLQKAYYFYPDYQTSVLLFNTLLFYIDKCDFNKVTEIDYLAQLSRFPHLDAGTIAGLFSNMIGNHLQYTDKENLCDSLYTRFVSQLTDEKLKEEVSFSYNMQMSYRFQFSDQVEKYVARAIQIKGNHYEAKILMENYLNRKLYDILNFEVLLDTVIQLEKRLNHQVVKPILLEHKLKAYLEIAGHSFAKKKFSEGNRFLLEFEKYCELPLKSALLSSIAETTYRTAALYYLNKGKKETAKELVKRGLKYTPNSRVLESVID